MKFKVRALKVTKVTMTLNMTLKFIKNGKLVELQASKGTVVQRWLQALGQWMVAVS